MTEPNKQSKPSTENDPYFIDSSTNSDKTQNQTTEIIDSTEDPLEVNRNELKPHIHRPPQTTTAKEEGTDISYFSAFYMLTVLKLTSLAFNPYI